jgi:hypothetical protein
MVMSLANAASIATVLTGVAALLALAFAIWQTREYRKSQLEALAREQYQNFLELCIKHPEYAPPGPDLDMVELTFAGYKKKFVQYEWFFTAGSNALEAIFLSVGEESSWQETICSILVDHAKYLNSQRYDAVFRPTVDPRYQRFVDQKFSHKTIEFNIVSADTLAAE